ncbi:photosynthetic complex assembly protein PuhC [Aestuariivirga sp.]|uniref:photosynthetic complex assembly protein PuhC n=1 Tax=Aestuariivirga sp. TaxID=2650926 RepID=UPI003BA92ACF
MDPMPVRSDSPKLPVMWAAALVLTSLIAVAGARIAGVSPVQQIGNPTIVESRSLRFDTNAAGQVSVVDTATGKVISDAGKEGFIPGVLRGLHRLRMTNQADVALAYRLERMSNGQLLLIDTASGVTLDLAAYGRDNAAVFAAFLSPTGDKS